MSTKNRGDRIQLLHKVVSKHFTPVLAPEDRSVLEHLLYACCVEDAAYEAADEAFHRLQESFFDWNEVRVTTVSELSETLHNLPDPDAAAVRIKKNLQSLFETRYSFDLDDMIKMNQGKAIQELEKLAGVSRFVLGYVTQNALGGHAIPVSDGIMKILLATEIVSEAEAAKNQVPGLERTVPKTKGPQFASCLHQFGLLCLSSPAGKQTKAILKESGAAETQKPASVKSKVAPKAASQSASKESPKEAVKAAAKSETKKETPAKPTAKKAASKKVASKPTEAKKSVKKTPAKKSTKRKPR
jgi:endonuclease III